MAGASSRPPPAPPATPIQAELADELINAFVQLARGDFSVRLQRNFKRDTHDVLAFFVNLIGEEIQRIVGERQRAHEKLENDIARLLEVLVALAAGNFGARAERTWQGDPIDVLAYMLNNMAGEIGDMFGQIEQQRDMLETILESMVDGVLLLDEKGRIVRANGAMAGLLECAPVDLVGTPVSEILSESEAGFASRLSRMADRAPFRDRDTVFRTRGGNRLAMTVNASPHRDRAGALIGVVVVARDDRELRRIQAKLRITDRLATMGTVAAGVAHEINNPLAFVLANLDYIAEELDDHEQGAPLGDEQLAEMKRAVEASQTGATRVRHIVRDLKRFARGDTHAQSRIDLNALLESASALIHNEVRHHGSLVRKFGTVPGVLANEGRLVQVFLNLIQNAAQAIPPGDASANQITITTGTDESGRAFVEVSDTGCGIDPRDVPYIFDLFFTTKPVGVGTGLGLSICHELVTDLGGSIDVRSVLGEGTTMRVVLPPHPDEAMTEPSSSDSLPLLSGKHLRILVVDDEVEVGAAVERMLGKDHEVHAVTRAADALKALDGAHFDAILCDLLMPEMTGMQLYEHVAEHRPELTTRFVFMTGGAFNTSAREFTLRAPNATIEKPFDAWKLRAALDEAAQKASSS